MPFDLSVFLLLPLPLVSDPRNYCQIQNHEGFHICKSFIDLVLMWVFDPFWGNFCIWYKVKSSIRLVYVGFQISLQHWFEWLSFPHLNRIGIPTEITKLCILLSVCLFDYLSVFPPALPPCVCVCMCVSPLPLMCVCVCDVHACWHICKLVEGKGTDTHPDWAIL